MGVWCETASVVRRGVPAALLVALLATGGLVSLAEGEDGGEQNHHLDTRTFAAVGLLDTLETSRESTPGAAVAGPLRAIAQAHAVPLTSYQPDHCPSLEQAISLHAQRLGVQTGTVPPGLPIEAEQALSCLLNAVHQANLAMDRTFDGLERDQILQLYEAAIQQRPFTPELLTLLEGRDHSQNLIAAVHLAETVDRALPLLHALQADTTPLVPIDLEPVLRFAPDGTTHHDRNYALIVDLEGDDLYTNHAGGIIAAAGGAIWDVEDGSGSHGASLLGQNVVVGGNVQDADTVLSASLVLDLDGDDTYGQKREPILKDEEKDCTEDDVVPMVGTIGSGVLGTGMLFDLKGDDTFIGRTVSQGAGHVLGVGVLYPGGGEDTFEAIRLAQGSGLLGGIGLLLATQGNDTYLATSPEGGVFNGDLDICDDETRYAQGSSFDRRAGPLLPSIGILADLDGHDEYTSQRKSHGFGQGPGLGLLYDALGDDRYLSQDLAQGAAQGRNVETHPQAPWGAGQALLIDRRGDDAYNLTGHPLHGHQGQGYSLGQETQDPPAPTDINALIQWAVDRREAIGMLLDGAGTDTYTGPPGRGDDTVETDGTLGLFIDQDQDEP